jgi:hypothetical protein
VDPPHAVIDIGLVGIDDIGSQYVARRKSIPRNSPMPSGIETLSVWGKVQGEHIDASRGEPSPLAGFQIPEVNCSIAVAGSEIATIRRNRQ